MSKVLLAGATGYLGGYILKELVKQEMATRVLARKPEKIDKPLAENNLVELVQAEVTQPESIAGSCEGIDTVISTVGITRQRDGLSYMDVDYQANCNLLEEAKRSGVRRFIYLAALNGEYLRKTAICRAKELFVHELKASGLDYCIIRPNGFFSDLSEFFTMAQKGRIYLFGDGHLRMNPIHGEDLARECVKAIQSTKEEINIGGPQTLSQKEIAQLAFEAAGKKTRITCIPDGIRRMVLGLARILLPKYKFGPVEFFLTAMAMEMVAPEYGEHTLRAYFEELKAEQNREA